MSRLAIFSDVHGNMSAFEAFLQDAEAQGASDYLCLGDHAGFGPQPSACLERLQDINCPVIMGNADQRLLEPRKPADLTDKGEDAAVFEDIDEWCAQSITMEQKTFVKTFLPYKELEFEGLSILAYHGSPKSFNNLIVPETDDETLDAYFDGLEADLYTGGHTHVQFIKRYHDKRIMNPGSVGLPYVIYADGSDANLAVAEYALLELVSGQPNVTFRRIVYDLEKLAQAVRSSSMPHQERWLGDFKQA